MMQKRGEACWRGETCWVGGRAQTEEGLVGENRGWITGGDETGGRASGHRGRKVVEASGAPL